MDSQGNIHPEVSVGITIRHVTSSILEEYSQTIRHLANDSSPEAKREALSVFMNQYPLNNNNKGNNY